jgi:hypothetical protein
MRIRDGKNLDPGWKNSDPGYGMGKIRIQDPGWKNSDPGWKKFGFGMEKLRIGMENTLLPYNDCFQISSILNFCLPSCRLYPRDGTSRDLLGCADDPV